MRAKLILMALLSGIYFCSPSYSAYSQCINISGPDLVCTGQEVGYSPTINTGCCPFRPCEIGGTFSWSAVGGTIVTTPNEFGEVVVVWGEGGGQLSVSYSGGVGMGGSFDGFMVVTTFQDQGEAISQSDDVVCENGIVNLFMATGYRFYSSWEFKDSFSSEFKPLNTFFENSRNINVTIADIYGSDFQEKFGLDNPIFFRVKYSCDFYAYTQNPIYFLPPPPVITAATVSPPLCRDGTGSIMISNFSRDVVSGETMNISIRRDGDINGVIQQRFNISLDDLPITITGIPPGNYEAYVESFIGSQPTGCSSLQFYDFTISNPLQVSFASNTPLLPSCHANTTGTKDNGSITINASGGSGTGYQYSKDNGLNYQSSNVLSGLTTGNYTVLIKDSKGCLSGSSVIGMGQPTDITVGVPDVIEATCFGGSTGQITMNSTGGNAGGLQYSKDGINFGGNVFTGLTGNTYTITIRDTKGCTKQRNVAVSNSNGPAIAVQTISPASCSNTSDGTATISITQGQAPYTILWPNNQTTATATNLAGGDYTVEVRDNTNCLALQTITVPAPQILTLQTTTQLDPNCNGNSDGQITVSAQGGNGEYTYSWNTGSTNPAIINLAAGVYIVTTKDRKNCQATLQYTLINPPEFTINLGADEKICAGQTITKTVSEANATYSWTGPNSFVSTQQQVSLSQPGTYTATVISQKGCQASDGFVLSFDTDLLKTDFLMVSEAFTGDTIIVIAISWPVPTTSNWQFDSEAIIIDENLDYSLIRFDEPGTYSTTLQAQLAQCASSYSQSITIVDNPDEEGKENGKKGEKIIRTLHVYPNPAQQNLTIEIELNRINETRLELYHLHSNKREFVKTFNGNNLYETEIRLDHLQSGLYVVVVKTGNEIKSVKVIKL